MLNRPTRKPPGSTRALYTETEVECKSHVATTGKRPPERHLVGVLEVAPDGQSARQPRDPRSAPEAVGDVAGRCLAGHVRVGREHDLDHAVALHAGEELVDPEVVWLDSVERRQGSAEHLVDA